MAYRTPNFNLAVNLWRTGTPYGNPPTLQFMASLSPGHRIMIGTDQLPAISTAFTAWPTTGLLMELLCPIHTDIRGPQNAGLSDVVEVPAASGRCYTVQWVDDVGKGYANEYRLAILRQLDYQTTASAAFGAIFSGFPAWPVPTP